MAKKQRFTLEFKQQIAPQIKAFREQGLYWKVIGEKLGIYGDTARKIDYWLYLDKNKQKTKRCNQRRAQELKADILSLIEEEPTIYKNYEYIYRVVYTRNFAKKVKDQIFLEIITSCGLKIAEGVT